MNVMYTTTDIAIVVGFLVTNLILGIWFGRGIKTLKEYAIGNRDFSTGTLAATLIATWISGSYFTVCISQTYSEGIWFLPAAIGNIFSLLIVGYLLAPRMKEFFGSLSVAETMGNLFGKHVRSITAVASIAQAIGNTALQIKVFSTVFHYFLGISSLYGTAISSFVVIFYSTWGGVKAVTFTDKIQLLTFGVFIPIFFFFVIKIFGDVDAIAVAMDTNPILDYTQLINWHDPKFFPNLIILLWFLIPSFNSTTFQRMLMAKDTQQMRLSFSMAALGYGAIVILTCAIAVIVLSINSNLDANNIVMYVVDHYSFEGLRGITVIGIMAMVMSTADSWLNTGSVIFAHDICTPLGLKPKNALFVSRIFTIFAGVGALLLVLFSENLFRLFTLQSSFYMPIVTVPLILAICGFRSSPRAVIIGMVSGALCVFFWKMYIQPTTGVDAIIPAILANLISLMGSHYILGEPGGWVGIKDDSDIQKLRLNRKDRNASIKNRLQKLFSIKFSEINILNYCNKYIPKNESLYVYFAATLLFSVGVTTITLDIMIYQNHLMAVTLVQVITLFIVTSLACYKSWNPIVKAKYMGIIWCSSIFFGLVFISSFITLISNFSTVSIVALILNLIVLSLLIRWQMALIMIVSGVYCAICSYEIFIGDHYGLHDLEMNIFYISFAICTLLLIFLKPKQDHEELVEEKNEHLKDTLDYQEIELQSAIDLKNEFLRNLEHEVHTPITGITSMGQILWESYDLLSEQQRRQGLEDIAQSSERLASLVNNMVDLSKLSGLSYTLNKQKTNLSDLVNERLIRCSKLYLKDKQLNFKNQINKKIFAKCDPYYILRVVDNLIINAIQYTTSGTITINLSTEKNFIKFSICDEGLAVPQSELYDIFGAFVVSSKTRSLAGGRGVGLALCKKSIEAHGGKIWAESNGTKGATFSFAIPI